MIKRFSIRKLSDFELLFFFILINLVYNHVSLDSFFTWDDTRFIYQAREILLGRSSPFDPIEGCLRATCFLYLTPLAWISPISPLLFRLAGVILQSGVVFSLFIIINFVFQDRRLAMITAFTFLFMGTHVEAIFNIGAVGHPLSLFFSLVSIYFLKKAFIKDDIKRFYLFYLLSILSFFLGVFAKEPGLICFFFIFYFSLLEKRNLRKTMLIIFPYIVVSLIFVVRVYFLRSQYSGLTHYIKQTPIEIIPISLRYLNSFAPRLLPHVLARQLAEKSVLWIPSVFLIIATCSYHLKVKSKWSSILTKSIFCFYLVNLPFLFVPLYYGKHLLISRHLYIGNVFFSLYLAVLFILLLDWLKQKTNNKRIAIFACAIALLIYVPCQYTKKGQIIKNFTGKHQVKKAETIFWSLYQHRNYLEKVDNVMFIKAPHSKLFVLQISITSLVRLIGPNHLIAALVDASIGPGDKMTWVNKSGTTRKSGMIRLGNILSSPGYMHEIATLEKREESKPYLLVYFNQKDNEVLYSFIDFTE